MFCPRFFVNFSNLLEFKVVVESERLPNDEKKISLNIHKAVGVVSRRPFSLSNVAFILVNINVKRYA